MTRVFCPARNGRSRLTKVSTPGFCKPMALSMPPYTSATRGVGLPSQGTSDTPLVTTAPSRLRSTKSAYSIPDPNVPDAVITGFFSSIPAILTAKFILLIYPVPRSLQRPWEKRPNGLSFMFCCTQISTSEARKTGPSVHTRASPSGRHSPGTRPRRTPSVPPARETPPSPAPPQTA